MHAASRGTAHRGEAKNLFGRVERDSPRTADDRRLSSSRTKRNRSRILDVLLSQLIKILAARPGADQG
jgi:hypothetical protein